ncbi:SDR family oxidoreductase [Luteipulveratus mongoliensis]|uniref:3-hydroxybutyrate dehydrogenase n=1 Tax=Luteipulveratus mongoliensis TaxID=571913 RepID=A0A0K1JMG2_9MICO|nr:SDR family oxidoreductase [Luteipulveratus mongoliensis]AKU17901.1 3-hydroxybutyrate dehydrogenase [Luteipulveratus mongoliensis]
MNADANGRMALITGGSTEIGAACARALAASGARVVVADQDEHRAGLIASAIGGQVWPINLQDTAALASLTLDADILVNAAGATAVAPLHELTPQDFGRVHRVLVEAPYLLIRAALPHMYDRGWGRIINITSAYGRAGAREQAAAVSAAHALEGLSKVTALEAGPRGVTSNCVSPAQIRTAELDDVIARLAAEREVGEDVVVDDLLARSSIKRFVEAREVAALVTWLAGDDAAMVNGASYAMDGGWTAA